MTDNFLIGTFILIAIFFIFGIGSCIGIVETNKDKNQLICKQLYQKDTNAYINCNAKSIEENIKLIKDISNDR